MQGVWDSNKRNNSNVYNLCDITVNNQVDIKSFINSTYFILQYEYSIKFSVDGVSISLLHLNSCNEPIHELEKLCRQN